jgi:hypothetical protein
MLGDLDKTRGLEALDSLAACLISADVVPARGLLILGRVIEDLDHRLSEAYSASPVGEDWHDSRALCAAYAIPEEPGEPAGRTAIPQHWSTP